MVVEVNFDPAHFRQWLLLLGGSVTVLAWFTRDEHWSGMYWLSLLTGKRGAIDVQFAQAGGLYRGLALVAGIGLLALGLAGPWLADTLGVTARRI